MAWPCLARKYLGMCALAQALARMNTSRNLLFRPVLGRNRKLALAAYETFNGNASLFKWGGEARVLARSSSLRLAGTAWIRVYWFGR